MNKLKEILEGVLGLVFIILFVLFFLKQCSTNVWVPPTNNEFYYSYSHDFEDYYELQFSPDSTLYLYHENFDFDYELIKSKISGIYGKKYFGRIWNINNRNFLFGFRILPKNMEPIILTSKVLEKIPLDSGFTQLPAENEIVETLMLNNLDSIKLGYQWFFPATIERVNYLDEYFIENEKLSR